MKRPFLTLVAALMFLFAVQSAHASTWRSNTGNIFNFQAGGYMSAYTSGNNYSGTWWWVRNGAVFAYSIGGTTATVTLQGKGAVCQLPGSAPQYWTQMAGRGDNKPDDTSWFMPAVLP